MRVRGDGLITEPLTLTLAPLPAAPGAFAATLDSLQTLVDLSLAREGLTRADILAPNARDVLPNRILPLAIIQTLLDDPSHNSDLRDLLRSSPDFVPLVGAAPVNPDLLDRIAAATGLNSYWNELLAIARNGTNARVSVNSANGLNATNAISSVSARNADGTAITDGFALSEAMKLAAQAKRSIDPGNPALQIRENLSLALGAAGILTGPLGGTVVVGASVTQYLSDLSQEMMAKTLPSQFVPDGISFSVTIPKFMEDEVGPGEFYNVRASAQSEGMVFDKALLEAVLVAVGGVRNAGNYFPATSGIVNKINAVGSFIAGKTVGKMPIGDGILRIPPEIFPDIPLLDERWTTSRVSGTAIRTGSERFYHPVHVGTATLTVETNVSHFGDATPVLARETIEVGVISIEVNASRTAVAAGDIVTLDILVNDAVDVNIGWTLSAGSWATVPVWIGGNAWRGQLQTPTQTGLFPVRATFRSTSTSGARGSPGAPDRSTTREIFLGMIIVEPFAVTLVPNESQQFTATVLGLENKTVSWSAVGPTGAPAAISSNGVFTAPTESGQYTVTATSQQDPEVKGSAIAVVSGVCSWTLDIAGPRGGSWTGQVAGHFYPEQPSGGGSFWLTFDRDDSGNGPTGTVTAAGPGGNNAAGSWPALFGFSPTETGPIWVAMPASGTTTETSATLSVSTNDGSTVVGTVSGTAMLQVGNGQEEYADFILRFRSARDFNCVSN